MSDSRVSDFLLEAARCIDSGEPMDTHNSPVGWAQYAVLTLPDSEEWSASADDRKHKALRFMLAAAIAKSEGR